jgi:hypothetical protein
MSTFTSRRLVPLALAAGLTVGGVAAITVAAEASGTAPTYHACLSKGLLTKVSTKTHSCSTGTKVSWNAEGPQGLPGANGTNGTDGTNGKNGAPGPGAMFFTANGSFQVSASVSHLEIIAIGGGGGGGGAEGNATGGGGGQAATETVLASVNPGDVLTINVGKAGALGASSYYCPGSGDVGAAGLPTVVTDGATPLAFASGGSGGSQGTISDCSGTPVAGAGGPGGGFVATSGVVPIAGSGGTDGATDPWVPSNEDCGPAGGGPIGVAGSGGQGGSVNTGICSEAAAQGGYVEILPY